MCVYVYVLVFLPSVGLAFVTVSICFLTSKYSEKIRQDIVHYFLTFNMVLLETGTNFPAVNVNCLLAEAIVKTRVR